MTTSDLMSLPIDIPRELLVTSEDMIDVAMDKKYPPKWRSSISVFYYEPPKEEQTIDNRIITYLKISCTIAGYQNPTPDPI